MAVVTVALMGATDARAGDFTVSYCVDANGTPVGQLADVQLTTSGRPGTFLAYECARPEGSGVQLAFDGSQPHYAGEYARATIDVDGAGMSIVGASAEGHYVPGTYDVSVAPLAVLAGPCLEPGCNAMRDWSGSWSARSSQELLDHLTFAVTCNQPECGGGMLAIHRLAVTYRDDAGPTAGSITGTLLNSAPGAPIAGPATVRISAADTGSGVRRGNVVVDGAIVGATRVQCAAPDRQHPCPSRLDEQVTVDTAKFAHGTHDLQITATDASGNTTSVWRGPLIVDNGAALGPGADLNLRGSSIGGYPADNAQVDAWWPATGRAPSRHKAVQRRCKRKAYARRHTLACRGRAPSRSLKVRWSAKKASRIGGRLVAPDGRPVVGARLDLVETPAAEAARSRVVATLATGWNGGFSAAVPVATGSATYTVRWFARERDNQPANAVAVRRTVVAATTFSASAKRLRPGRTLTLRGRLRGRAGTLRRNAIAIQANAGRSWRAVTTVRTRANGRWTARYRIPKQLHGRYRFRAVVTPSAGYPYAPGASRTRRLTVR